MAEKENSGSYILSSNLEIALAMAIECRARVERQWKYTSDSALLPGWKENLKALQAGKLEIR